MGLASLLTAPATAVRMNFSSDTFSEPARKFAKPLDQDLLFRLAADHEVLITVEEGSIGGFGSFVMQSLAEDGAFDGVSARSITFRSMVLPDRFLDHDKPEKLYAGAGLDAKGIVAKVLATLGRASDARKSMIA